MKPEDNTDYNQPVAYDNQGRPLYAHPPSGQPPQVVYMSRSVEPHRQEPSAEVQAKHEESLRLYPHLNLSDHEYVISAIRRHPIGLVSIWSIVIAAILIILVGFPLLLKNVQVFGSNLSTEAVASAGLILLLSTILIVLGGVIATIVYEGNRFFLTNESVMQHIQTSLFTKKNQVISLANIEDASFRQKGILQMLLNYGAIRLSTEGEETTYRFNYVANPSKQIDLLNDAVESFKNYRPVGDASDD